MFFRAIISIGLLGTGIFIQGSAVQQGSNMHMYAFFIEAFEKDGVSTEAEAYHLLKETPLPADISYVAIPWAFLINNKNLDLVEKLSLSFKNGVTVCQHIRYEKIIPLLKKIGVTTLFTPHASAFKTYDGVKVLAFPHVAKNGVLGASIKDVWYSLIGYDSHPVRTVLFKMSHPENTIIKERKYWHWARDSFIPNCVTQDQQKAEAVEYQDVLARSRFSLCPRGTGPSTIRFWESLQAGAIPVLLADEMMLPDGFDWDTCVVKIAEKDAQKINEILKKISPEQENDMRAQCLKAYELFSGENLVRCIRLHY